MQIKREADGSIAFSTQGQESLQDVLAAICSLPAGVVATATIATATAPKASGNGVHREPAKEGPTKEKAGDIVPPIETLPLVQGKLTWPAVEKAMKQVGFTGNKRSFRTALRQRKELQPA